jgi:hypothetical protein
MVRSLSEKEREKLTSEIAGLQSLGVEQLKSRWRKLYGSRAPVRFSRDLLVRAFFDDVASGFGGAPAAGHSPLRFELLMGC